MIIQSPHCEYFKELFGRAMSDADLSRAGEVIFTAQVNLIPEDFRDFIDWMLATYPVSPIPSGVSNSQVATSDSEPAVIEREAPPIV